MHGWVSFCLAGEKDCFICPGGGTIERRMIEDVTTAEISVERGKHCYEL